MVKSIVVGSTDVTDGAFELRGTEQVTNARIVLTDRVSELNGTVTVRNQEAKDSSVVVFADDAALWTFPTRFVRMARDRRARRTSRCVDCPAAPISWPPWTISKRASGRTPSSSNACVSRARAYGPRRRDQDGRPAAPRALKHIA